MNIVSRICLALVVFLAACTPYMYGVPQESWDRMSEPERIEAMRVYERDQQARRQAAEERARYEAQERQREQARQAAIERERRERVERIHRGDGAYGELVRVRLQGGKLRIADGVYRYEPLTFAIAEGELRRFPVAEVQGRLLNLDVSYVGGALTIEGVRFSYDRSWGRGRMYANTDSGGDLQLRNVDVFVEVHDRSSRQERESSRLAIYREPDHHTPPPVIIKEKEHPRPPQVIPPPTQPPVAELPPRTVEVSLLAGEMKVRGRMQPVERLSFRLAEGESREMTVRAGDEKRMVVFHYGNGELYVDGAPGRGRDSQKLTYEKGWWRGTVYRLTLKGKNQVEKVELRVSGL
jgi:hypothetical protein